MKYLAATVLVLVVLQTAAVMWIAVSWEIARRQTIAIMEETSNIVTSETIREVPVYDVPVRELPDGFTESTTSVTQELIHVAGVGSERTEPIELLSAGLWVV